MPIPFILGALAVGAGLFGAANALEASEKNDRAKELIEEAQERYAQAEEKLQMQRDATQKMLNVLGEHKVHAWSEKVGTFVKLYHCFKNIHVESIQGLDKEKLQPVNIEELKTMEAGSMNAEEILQAGIGTLGAGALAGIATYGGVMMFASAGTGASIATLSGAAATNATLAWLGGGTLAAGGLGVAGGAAVLGGVVLGPVLAVAGLISSAKADENLAQAEEEAAKADDATEKMKTVTVFLRQVEKRAQNYDDFIQKFGAKFQKQIQALDSIYNDAYAVQSKTFFNRLRSFLGVKVKIDFDQLSLAQQHTLHLGWQGVQILYSVLKQPLLTKEGNFDPNAGHLLNEARAAAKLLEA